MARSLANLSNPLNPSRVGATLGNVIHPHEKQSWKFSATSEVAATPVSVSVGDVQLKPISDRTGCTFNLQRHYKNQGYSFEITDFLQITATNNEYYCPNNYQVFYEKRKK